MDFKIIRNDITNMQVDAIVLPANSKLKEGSGTSTAIFQKAGKKELEKACKAIAPVSVGTTVPTLGFNLPANFILHSVVPKWKDGKHQEYDYLSSAYLTALDLADEMSCESIAFPLLASGNNGFYLEIAFEIAKECFEWFVPKNKLKDVYLVVYDRKVMSLLRDRGIEVEEAIDELYVMKKDEIYKHPVQIAFEEGKEVVDLFAQDALRMAKAYIENQQNREALIKQGALIAGDAIKAALHGAANGLVQVKIEAKKE